MSKINFKDYYKFPLKWDKGFSVKVFTQDNSMAFDFMMPMFLQTMYPDGVLISDDDKEKIVNCLNGEGNPPKDNLELKYNSDNTTIQVKDKEGKFRDLLVVRGWGALTGVGGHALPQEKAIPIQDAFAEFIVKTLSKK